MTKFEELVDIIAGNKRKQNQNNNSEIDKDEALEVGGSESTKTPLLSCGDDVMDPGLLSQLHRSAKTKPNDGSNAASWDATWD